MPQIDRLLPVIATWGAWGLAALLLITLSAVWRLGRGRRFLIPAGWPGRIGSAVLLGLAALWALGLYVVLGPMGPVLSQVRYVQGLVDRPAAEVEYRSVADDAPHRLSELRGKVVVLNLWATWCGPCRGELPEIDRLQRSYAQRGVVVVTLSTEEREQLQAFAAQHPVATLNVYAPRVAWLDVGGRPLSLIIDRRGVVRDCFIGARSYADFQRAVTKHMAAAS